MMFDEEAYVRIEQYFSKAANFSNVEFSHKEYIIEFRKTESGFSGSTTVRIKHNTIQSIKTTVEYLCILYRTNNSYRCAADTACCICHSKQLTLIDNTLIVNFNNSSITPDFLSKLILPVDIIVLFDTNKKVKYGNVTKINGLCNPGRLEFIAELVDGAGSYDIYSSKPSAKYLIFYREFPCGAYSLRNAVVTIVDPPCKSLIINNSN